jgi:hypothetical protein
MKAPRFSRYLAVPMAIAMFFLSAFKSNERINGNGNVKSEDRQTGTYKGINTSGDFNFYIDPAGKGGLKIEAEDNLLPYIVTEVNGSVLDVHVKKGYNIKATKPIKVYVSIAELESLTCSGSGGFYSEGALKGGNVAITFSGSTIADLNLSAKGMKVEISGSSKMDLKGAIASAVYEVSGEAKVDAPDLKSDDVQIDVSGTGKMSVNAQKKLDINVSGTANVEYKGNPSVNQSTSGTAKISRID